MSIFIANFYLLRNTYSKILDYNREFKSNHINLNVINWSEDIYKSNIKNLVRLKKYNEGILYELEYSGYKLFFLLEVNSVKKRTNVFWVNILKTGTIYEKYKNEKIIEYRLGIHNYNEEIFLNNQNYIIAYTGNALINFSKRNNLIVSSYGVSRTDIEMIFNYSVKAYLHEEFENYKPLKYEGRPIAYKFKCSIFNNYIIIY